MRAVWLRAALVRVQKQLPEAKRNSNILVHRERESVERPSVGCGRSGSGHTLHALTLPGT